MFADGGREKLKAAPTNSVRSLRIGIKTSIIRNRRITELIPGKRVVWLILDSYLNFTKDAAEWNGTEVVFDISKRAITTEVRFTHRGLVPAFECFNGCSNAWGFYINGSLRSLIATGKGEPNQKEKAARV